MSKRHAKAGSGKKAAERRKAAARKNHEPDLLTMADLPLVMEGMRAMERAIGEQEFSTIEAKDLFFDKPTLSDELDQILDEMEDDPIEMAQALAFDAMEAETFEEAEVLARTALALDPNCIDALNMREMAVAKSTKDAVKRMRAVIARGERLLGAKFMQENEGSFWALLETRPYMRACQQLVDLLILDDQIPEAIKECRRMLRLNPNDNQGMRDLLLGLLLEEQDHEGAEELIGQYSKPISAVFAWGKALARFQAEGPSPAADECLARAVKANRHAYDFLSGRKAPPPAPPAFFGIGDYNEGAICVESLGMGWAVTPGAMEWIAGFKPKVKRV